ncbi:hypothetical protein KQH56_00655 [bacterium]|nr:hypothetical protein [bacterium]
MDFSIFYLWECNYGCSGRHPPISRFSERAIGRIVNPGLHQGTSILVTNLGQAGQALDIPIST